MAGIYYHKSPWNFPTHFWWVLQDIQNGAEVSTLGVFRTKQEAKTELRRFQNFRWNLRECNVVEAYISGRVRASIISEAGLHSIHVRAVLNLETALIGNPWFASLNY